MYASNEMVHLAFFRKIPQTHFSVGLARRLSSNNPNNVSRMVAALRAIRSSVSVATSDMLAVTGPAFGFACRDTVAADDDDDENDGPSEPRGESMSIGADALRFAASDGDDDLSGFPTPERLADTVGLVHKGISSSEEEDDDETEEK